MKQWNRWLFKPLALAGLGITAAGISVILAGMGIDKAAHAIRLADGTVFFEEVPRLVNASITQQSVSNSNVGYYFDLSIPRDAGEALERIDIAQQNADLFTREVSFDLEDSQAFVGRRRDRQQPLSLGTVEVDDDTHTVSVTFDPPVPAGTDLTLRLEAKRNPRRSGVYLFGVTAYPEGTPSQGQFLGFGRFHIYDNGSSDIFR